MTSFENGLDQVRTQVAELISNKLFHPDKDNKQTVELGQEFADLWPRWVDSGDTEGGVNRWLRDLKLSHTGFWRGPGKGITSYFAINAALKQIDGRLVFWDILPGGLAQRAGISAGDVLIGLDGSEVTEDELRFQFGRLIT